MAGVDSLISVKQRVLAHVEMSRPYTVIWCGLVSLTGATVMNQGFPSVSTAVLVTFIPIMGWIAGLYLSDFLDRDLDKIQKPHRPIPSGIIFPWEALVIGGILAFSGFVLSFLLGFYNVVFVLPTALLVFLYGKYAKSRGIFGNIIRGMIIVIAFFFGVVAINQSFVEIPFGIVLLSVVFFIHDTNSNLIGAIRDVEGDQKGGYQTFPVKYGMNISLVVSIILSIVYETLLIISIFVFQFLQYPVRFYVLFIVSPLILIIMYVFLIRSRSTMNHRKALRAHEFMVAERITLASALIIGMTASYLLSLTIFIIAISFSLISQLVLRKRYEYVE